MILYMPLFRSCSSLRTLFQIHGHLLVTGLHKDALASTKLIESYAQFGSITSAKLVFDKFPHPDSFMCGVLIKCCVWSGLNEEALVSYHKLLELEPHISCFTFSCILRACCSFSNLDTGRKIHGSVIKYGFDDDVANGTSLLRLYGERGLLRDAYKVFDEMPIRDLVTWDSIITSCIENEMEDEALEMFRLAISEGVEPDYTMMVTVVTGCGELRNLGLARAVHCYIQRREFDTFRSLDNYLIEMYGKLGDVYSAEIVFKNSDIQCNILWASMICCYNLQGFFKDALNLVVMMHEVGIEPDLPIMGSILCSCSKLGLFKEGKSVHGFIIKKLYSDSLWHALVCFYADADNFESCEKAFHSVPEKNIFLWNVMISVCNKNGLPTEALKLFLHLFKEGHQPDSFTLSSCLSACADIELFPLGIQLHSCVIKTGFVNEFTQNSLISMYMKCRVVTCAFKVFDNVPDKDVVAWNSVISGLSWNGNSLKAINLFDHIYSNRLSFNNMTLLSVLQACSQSCHLQKGKWVHHKLIVFGVQQDCHVETALTDMYIKCGELKTARVIFDSMSEKTVVSWSAMISGYGIHGQTNEAIFMFKEMLECGVKPNAVTFLSVLSACSHAGLVAEGKSYFNLMKQFNIEPNSEHFICLIDLLSRAGNLDDAYALASSASLRSSSGTWAALLNGCRIHRRRDMIRVIERKLSESGSDDAGHYTLLSCVFREGGNVDDGRNARLIMRNIGLQKVPAYSRIGEGVGI